MGKHPHGGQFAVTDGAAELGPEPRSLAENDRATVAAQLGRTPRAIRAVAHRCPCGLPDVIESSPRLPDGTPFPTLYYLTCPRASAAIGRLEASGLMAEMTDHLASDTTLADRYRMAHESYLRRREQLRPCRRDRRYERRRYAPARQVSTCARGAFARRWTRRESVR